MSFEVLDNSADPIAPVSITHSVDEIRNDGRVEQHYNFLDYLFERDGFSIRARAYLDDIETVTVMLEPRPVGGAGERLVADIRKYLERRYASVEQLSAETTP